MADFMFILQIWLFLPKKRNKISGICRYNIAGVNEDQETGPEKNGDL